MTLTYELDLDIIKLYVRTRNEVCRSSFSKVTARTGQTDRQTDVTEGITTSTLAVDKNDYLYDCVYTQVSLMPTRWIFNEPKSAKQQHSTLWHFGRTFSRCDRPSNVSCILSDDYCHDNVTGRESSNTAKCCRTYDTGADSWRPMTWYYLHFDGVENVSEVKLAEIPPCENVPFHSKEDEIGSSDVDTFSISGKKLKLLAQMLIFYQISWSNNVYICLYVWILTFTRVAEIVTAAHRDLQSFMHIITNEP